MKLIKGFILAAVMVFAAMPMSAQFRIGPRVGVAVNDMHFNKSVFDGDNRAGFTAGVMTEFTVPVVGIGFDLSAMYVRRSAKWMDGNDMVKDNRDYIDIPLNLKWKIGVPVIGKIITPYLTTGPAFSFLTSRRAISDAYKNKSVDVAWNFGFGVQLIQHIQVGASYGLGLTKAVNKLNINDGKGGVEGKNRYWTITAAYLF